MLGFAIEVAQKVFCPAGVGVFAQQLKLLTAVADLDLHMAFDLAQMLVVLSAHRGKTGGFKAVQ